MRVPLSWLREYAAVPDDVSPDELAHALVRAGLEVEKVETHGEDVSGVVVGEVLEVEELTEFKKPIRWVQVDVGEGPRGVVCGATNFAVGDRVPVVLPGGVLPGGFRVTARETYGRVSNGMICSARELAIGDDHGGILVLEPDAPIGRDVVEHLSLRDSVLDIAVTPDRGYQLSVRGVAREAAIALEVAYDDPGIRWSEPANETGHPVRIEAVDGCTRYVARVVRGVDPGAPTPHWMARRIALAGMRPISLAVDITNYVLLGLGQPLHAFDAAALAGPIVVRRAAAGERLVTLDGVDRPLEPDDLVIADDSGAIALAGVMGGRSTEVGASTTDLLVESAHFTPVGIARTSRRLRLVSEASKRFEREVDPALAPVAAQLAVDLLERLGGGKADPGVTDVDERPERPVIVLAANAPGRIAGRDYDAANVRRRLVEVGCEVIGHDPLEVHPPPWRPDLTGNAELCEEVIRLEGYDTVPSELPDVPAGRGLTREQRLRRRAGRALAAAGYVEVTSYPVMGAAVLDAMRVPADDERRRGLRMANPLSEEEPLLRTTLLPGLFAAVARNLSRGSTDLALSETGLVFLPRHDAPRAPELGVDRPPLPAELAALDAALPAQPRHAAVVLAGARVPAGWWGPAEPAGWGDAVQAARSLATELAVALEVRRGDRAPWHPGRCAELVVGGAVIGHAGELHPAVVTALGLPKRACAMELDLDALVAAAPDAVPAPAVPTYPVATQDVALVVDTGTPAAEVEAALRDGAGELLESVRLFDVYTGDQVGEGRTSLAYALRFRAPDRTLTVEETTAARDAAVAEAARRVGAVQRA